MTPQRRSVVIIGAGESGIAVGCLLKLKLGVTDFQIYDRQGGIGGAWYINKYPGVACDIPALFYSYSFAPNYEWTSLFPPGREIQQYLASVCRKFDIVSNIQLNTEVCEARWLPESLEWEVHVVKLATSAGGLSQTERQRHIKQHGSSSVYLDREVIRCKVLITCAGELVEPNSWPKDVAGLETFQGDVVHSARWPDTINVAGKDVVVVGMGCTAAQLVPALINPRASSPRGSHAAPRHVTQLMRTAPWLMPRPPEPPWWFNRAMTALQSLPGLGLLFRFLLFLYAESTWLNVGMGWISKVLRHQFQNRLLTHMRKTVPPKYQDMLRPDFGVGCRRIIIDCGWLESLAIQDRFELTTRPLLSVTSRGVVLGPLPTKGASLEDNASASVVTKPADIIILANGFDTSTYLHRIRIVNAAGKSLHDVWRENGGPGAYLSTAVSGFPNFFMVLGPCSVSGHSSAILATENVAGYIINFVKLVLSGEARTVEVKVEAERQYTAEVQRRSVDKIWQDCKGGYISKNGWNSSICPFNQIHFGFMCRFPNWNHWDIDYTTFGRHRRQSYSSRSGVFWSLITSLGLLIVSLSINRYII
ncbi:hypothetical protein F4825DRAFT_445048 [Nemania diffusa]|nr:hypothetical protein F4825DRAFT_445048 [Nemania diffusa]